MSTDADQCEQPPGSHTKRVSYFVSANLVTASDALACHPGRSSLVHSLIYHSDLLSLPQGQQAGELEEGKELGNIQAAEFKLLEQVLDPDADYDDEKDGHGRKAQVVITSSAESTQLEAFHDSEYVQAIISGTGPAEKQIVDLHEQQDRPAKRAKADTLAADDAKFGLVDVRARIPLEHHQLTISECKGLRSLSTLTAACQDSGSCEYPCCRISGKLQS